MQMFTIKLIDFAGCELVTEVYSVADGQEEEMAVLTALQKFVGGSTMYIGDTIKIDTVYE